MTTRGYWKKSKFYWDVDVSAALDQEKTLQGKQLEEWKADAVRKIEQRDAVRVAKSMKARADFK